MLFTQHNDPTLDNLPQDLSKLTKKQTKALLAFYSSMTLKELRQRQDLCKEQTELAHKEHNDRTLSNLTIIEKFLFTVIFDGTYRK